MHLAIVIVDKNAKFSHQTTYFSGQNHTSINNNFNGGSLPAGIEIVNNLILLKCGYSIATSIDNGNTWQMITKGSYSNLLFTSTEIIFFGDPEEKHLMIKFYLYKSSNGSSWEKVFQQGQNKLYVCR